MPLVERTIGAITCGSRLRGGYAYSTVRISAQLLASLTGAVFLSGCFASASSRVTGSAIPLGDSRYLVVGVAVIEVAPPGAVDAAQVVRGKVLGLHVSNQPGLKVGIGYSHAETVRVPADTADDVRLEVREAKSGALQVQVDSAKIRLSSTHENKTK
jgi:hypothetical protein